jgi:hypothetical protein
LEAANGDPALAWRALCERMGDLSRELGADGVRHLARQVALALREQLEHADPLHPSFFRYEEPWAQWGGPNPDNVYVRAHVDPDATYRVWGNVAGVRQAVFSLHDGDMHEGKYGVFSECTLDELTRDERGRLEITLSPREHDGNWMRSHPGGRILTIRQFQSDWENDEIASFSIECLETRGSAGPREEPSALCAAIERATAWVDASTGYWQRYTERSRASLPRNAFSPPSTPPGGAATIGYGAGWFELGPDEALLIESDVPDADYWGWTMHTMKWLESGDFAARQTSLNHLQARVDGDGRVRIVAARRDPGAANWIDVEDRSEGLLVYRYVGARSKPVPLTRTVAIAELRDHLPPGHPMVDADERREQLARRCAAVLRRYV